MPGRLGLPPDSYGLLNSVLPFYVWCFQNRVKPCGLESTQRQKREVILDREGEIFCSVIEGSETIGRKDVIFLPSKVGGVNAIEEEVMVPVDNCVLKIVERGRYRGETVLPKIVLKFLDVILASRERVFWRTSRRMLQTPGRTCWRVSGVMMVVPSKEVVSQR